ncbi:hypothetical protein H6P81_000464 [Aristolochia fimbriata]|uniref:Uncharacterized protein n=1 Tax=Aristolochia fimbriata TaxID=158543 RepID=A0AAV7F7Z7_ARIFI|nr:hypothetical protein H6P81_000464 [Aristolochia fimbriata]
MSGSEKEPLLLRRFRSFVEKKQEDFGDDHQEGSKLNLLAISYAIKGKFPRIDPEDVRHCRLCSLHRNADTCLFSTKRCRPIWYQFVGHFLTGSIGLPEICYGRRLYPVSVRIVFFRVRLEHFWNQEGDSFSLTIRIKASQFDPAKNVGHPSNRIATWDSNLLDHNIVSTSDPSMVRGTSPIKSWICSFSGDYPYRNLNFPSFKKKHEPIDSTLSMIIISCLDRQPTSKQQNDSLPTKLSTEQIILHKVTQGDKTTR